MSKKPLPQGAPLAHQPFAALSKRMGALRPGPEPEAPSPIHLARPPLRAVIKLERKGRHGKEVTVVEQLELEAGQAGLWLHDLKAALGCGGVARDGVWILQGDQRLRVREWLVARGVDRVSVSG